MPYHCSVPNCRGNYNGGPNVTVFKFPNDERMKKIWSSRIGRDNFVPSSSSRVCHLHFEKEDVVWDTRSCDERTGQVLSVALRIPRLKAGAVPSLFPKCPAYAPKSRYQEQENENLMPENERRAPSLQCTSNTQNTLTLIFLGEFLVPIKEVELPSYRTICLSDHNYARPYHPQPKKNCVDVADCHSKTSDDYSRIAGRPPAVPQGSGDDSCGSRVGRPAPSLPPRRPPYSQYHCAVYRCATNGNKMPGVTCHYFPKDESLQREWLARCRRTGYVNLKNARVCSIHFRPEDYERDLRNELLGLPLRKKLIPTAVPSLNLPSWEEVELRDVCAKKLGRSRKKLWKCDDNEEGDSMDAVVQQIVMNPPEVIIKEEPAVQEESECDVGTGAQQDFGYVSVKEEPIEDLDESTSSAPEDFGYVSVKEEPIEDLDESTSSAPESYEQMRQDQELPLIIKEEIDCDDYIDPFRIS